MKVDATSGAAALVVANEICSNLPLWAPSGRSVFCYQEARKSIVEIDVASGQVRRTYPGTGIPGDISPDGTLLLYTAGAGRGVLTLSTGDTRDIIHDGPELITGGAGAVAFGPQARGLLAAAIVRGTPGVWLFPIEGGALRKVVDVTVETQDARGILLAVGAVRFNAATGQMLYALNAAAAREVWRMEHFLPGRAAAASRSLRGR